MNSVNKNIFFLWNHSGYICIGASSHKDGESNGISYFFNRKFILIIIYFVTTFSFARKINSRNLIPSIVFYEIFISFFTNNTLFNSVLFSNLNFNSSLLYRSFYILSTLFLRSIVDLRLDCPSLFVHTYVCLFSANNFIFYIFLYICIAIN